MKDSKWKPQLIIIKNVSGYSETYSEPSEKSNMELSAKIVDCIQSLTIFAKHFILVVSQGYEYASDKAKQTLGALSLIPQKLGLQSANFFHF